jgi:hypothetical protein
MRYMRNTYKSLDGIIEGKTPLGRRKRRCEDNIRMDLREIGWEYVDRTHLAPDRDQWRTLVKTVMNLRVQYKAGNSLTS